jgi:photosystem II stability/assembly factor-like uncharacterized protein
MPDIPTSDEHRAVYALALSPQFGSDGVCYAATGAGLLRSADGAVGFAQAYESLNLPQELPTTAVVLSPAFARDRTVFAGVSGAVLRSRDDGERWQYATLRTPPPVVTCLAVSPAYESDGEVFAGTLEDGVFRSADRGGTWASWNFGLIDLSVLCVALSPTYGQDETLLAGTDTGLFRSTNGGRAWRETSFPGDLAPILCLAFSPQYESDGTVYAGTEAAGLWVSHNRGKSWQECPSLSGEAVNAVVVDTRNGLRVAVLTDSSLLESNDGGKTFEKRGLELAAQASPVCLAADEGGALLVGADDGRVLRVASGFGSHKRRLGHDRTTPNRT